MLAPAFTSAAALCRSTPPSTETGAVLPTRSRERSDHPDLVEALWDEPLAAEPWVDRHHEHDIGRIGDLFDSRNRRRWVERDPGAGTEGLDGRQRSRQVSSRLNVHGQGLCPSFDKRGNVAVRILDHQVDVEGHVGDPMEGTNDWWPDREVWNEVAVHDVHVNGVCATALGGRDGSAQLGEIGRQDRGSDSQAHRRLISKEIGSPGEI